MKLQPFLPLVGLFTNVANAFVRTHTFRRFDPGSHNVSVEVSVSGADVPHHILHSRADDDDADKQRWDKAVCKGGELLDAMAGDEKRAGNWFKVPKESGESEYQDYSKL